MASADELELSSGSRRTGRVILDVGILAILWLLRDRVFGSTEPDWKVSIAWGVVTVTLLDSALVLLPALWRPLGRSIARGRKWWVRRRGGAGQPVGPPAGERGDAMSVDEPIGSIVEDQLGFGKYAFVLAQFLARSPTPMTIGIHGEWGTGKSSLAHLIQELLRPRDRDMNPKSPWRTDEELKALELPPEDEKDEARRRREREFDAGSKLKRLRADLQASGVDIDARLPDSQLYALDMMELNAWQYGSANSLWRSLVLQLTALLDERGLGDSAVEWRRKLYYSVTREEQGEIQLNGLAVVTASARALLAYAGYLVLPSTWLVLALQASGLAAGGDFKAFSLDNLLEQRKFQMMRKQMESIEEFREALKELIALLLKHGRGDPGARKVIIFIDDLDRCLPEVALEIMETIKTFLEVQGCVYVLLCDQRLLGQGVRAKFEEIFGDEQAFERRGQEYIEKIVQVAFHIPPSDRTRLKRYAEEALRELYVDQEIPYFDIVFATVADNPRKVKRLCRGLELAFSMLKLRLGYALPSGDTSDRSLPATNGRSPASVPTGSTVPPVAGSDVPAGVVPASVPKAEADRRKEFAKVYCLQYGWPEALPLLRAYQASGQSTVPTRSDPKGDPAIQKVPEGFEFRQIEEVRQEVEKMLAEPDLKIFGDLLVSVAWDEVRESGTAAVKRTNPQLLRFLRTKPFFETMTPADLKDYIEWSGVIGTDEQPSPTATGTATGSDPGDWVARARVWASQGRQGSLSRAILNDADLSDVDLSGADLSDSSAKRVDLRRANLNEANLERVDLDEAKLESAQLNHARLENAVLTGTRLADATLYSANLSFARAQRADLTGADLRGVNFAEADLTGARLTKADLTDARFFNTRWQGAILDGVIGMAEEEHSRAQREGAVETVGAERQSSADEEPSEESASDAQESAAIKS